MPTACYDPSGKLLGIRRMISSIRADVQALLTTQWNNLWANLSAASGGVPRLYLTSDGVNAGAMMAMDFLANSTTFTAAQQLAHRYSIAACYIQDQPQYAVAPSFDPSINIPGYQ